MLKGALLAVAIAFAAGPVSAAIVDGGAPTDFFDFAKPGKTDAGSFAFDVNGTTVTATGKVFDHPTHVRQTPSGLGVNGGLLDFEKDEVGASEKLQLTFDRTFNLAAIVIDDLTTDKWKTDKGVVALVRGGSVIETVAFDATSAIGQLLTISFAGGALVDALHFAIDSTSKFSAQNFAVRGLAEVPVPAALPLLASGIAGLAWLRRRRSA